MEIVDDRAEGHADTRSAQDLFGSELGSSSDEECYHNNMLYQVKSTKGSPTNDSPTNCSPLSKSEQQTSYDSDVELKSDEGHYTDTIYSSKVNVETRAEGTYNFSLITTADNLEQATNAENHSDNKRKKHHTVTESQRKKRIRQKDQNKNRRKKLKASKQDRIVQKKTQIN